MASLPRSALKKFLDEKVTAYEQPDFIPGDPVSIPHLFTVKQDIEIAGFFAAIFAWGNRTTIINKSRQLMELMGMQPYRFCLSLEKEKIERLLSFKHRTFNSTDLLYFIEFFHFHYSQHDSLETAFTRNGSTIREMLSGFHDYFFSLPDIPQRTRKHIATPDRKATCKRLNMYLRWMVRPRRKGVDFGIWETIAPADLVCPIDVHVARVAKQLKLLTRKQTDWLAAEELTANLRVLDATDPVKYDFALFTLGAEDRF